MGRQTVATSGPFRFEGLSPGAFELYAQAPIGSDPAVALQGAYLSSTLQAESSASLTLSRMSNPKF
jgi:hypothetical protein